MTLLFGMTNAELLRKEWDKRGPRRLKLKNRPPADFTDDPACREEIIQNNIKLRMYDLAETMELLFNQYRRNKDLYGDNFLAFVGNSVVREWPWKDYPFTSKNAFEHLAPTEPLLGKLNAEIADNSVKERLNETVYEHWTPLSFFRDVFEIADELDMKLSKEDFYEMLLRNYRIVRVTKDEDDRLAKEGYRSRRLKSTYADLEISIHEKEDWDRWYT